MHTVNILVSEHSIKCTQFRQIVVQIYREFLPLSPGEMLSKCSFVVCVVVGGIWPHITAKFRNKATSLPRLDSLNALLFLWRNRSITNVIWRHGNIDPQSFSEKDEAKSSET